MVPGDLGEVYDPDTLAAIDAWEPPREPGAATRLVGGWRARFTGGALLTAVALGLQEVFEPPRPAEIVEVDPWERTPVDAWVRFCWHPDPRLSVALVTPR
ncbi:MAG: hypothetical protein IPM45_13375 [Acidimicrobiales bacterium]|nr:hypothetical protein [Acidimicrobiales bacterium]